MLEYDKGASLPQKIDVTTEVGRFYEFNAMLAAIERQVEGCAVVDDESLAVAVETNGQMRKLRIEIDKKRKGLRQPYLDAKKRIDGVAGELSGRCQQIIDVLDSKQRPYLLKKDEERRKREQEARERAEKERQRAEAETRAREEAKAAGSVVDASFDEEPETPTRKVFVPEVIETETKIKTSSGSVKVEYDEEPEIADIAKAAADPGFLKSRGKWIAPQILIYARQMMKLGHRNIPGIVIKEVPKVKTRAI